MRQNTLRAGRGIALCHMETMKVRGITIGEVEGRLCNKTVMALTRSQAMPKCGVKTLCGRKGGA